MKLDGSIAVVTGAAGGIGAALAERIVARGGRVLLADLSDAVAEVAARLDSPAWVGDVSSVDGIAALLDSARSHLGEVDLYFANAGITGPSGLGTADADWDAIIDVNLRAHVRAAQALIPGWQERGSGHFVATASAAGLLTQIGSAGYAVTKHAAVGFAEWLAVTYRNDGIRASVLCPMGVNTNLLNGIGRDSDSDGAAAPAGGAVSDADARIATAARRAVTEAGRVLEPADVAEVALNAVENDEFLILPHPEVLEMYRMKSADYGRWLRGMSRYQATLLGD